MKIAIYSGEIPSTTFIELLIRNLCKKDFEIYIFGTVKRKIKYNNEKVKIFATQKSGIKAVCQFLILSFKYLLKNPKGYMKVLKIYKKENFSGKIININTILPILLHQPDIFHMQWVKTVPKFELLFDLMPKTKFVLSFRGSQINISPVIDGELAKTYKRLFKKIDYFHAVSKKILEKGTKYNADIQKSAVIFPAVDDNLLKIKPQINRENKTLKIITIGRFHWNKGYNYLIDALGILKEQEVNFQFTLIAQGNNKEDIIYQIHDWELENQVKIINGLPHDAVIEMLTKSDLFILSSLEEGIANVVLEAMAVGVPVISTDCGGMKEVIEDKKNGLIVSRRNPKAICEAVKYFSRMERQEIEDMIGEARKTIQKNHLASIQLDKFETLYKKIK